MRDRRSILESDRGLELVLHVQPRARRTEFAGLRDGALKLRVDAPPVDDAANRAVLAHLAALLGIPRSRIRILSGDRSRTKRVVIEGMGLEEFLARVPDAARLNR